MLLTDIIRYRPYQYLLIFPLNLLTMQKKIIKPALLVFVISLCSFTFYQFDKNQILQDILMSATQQGLIVIQENILTLTPLGKRFLNDLMQMFLMEEVTND